MAQNDFESLHQDHQEWSARTTGASEATDGAPEPPDDLCEKIIGRVHVAHRRAVTLKTVTVSVFFAGSLSFFILYLNILSSEAPQRAPGIATAAASASGAGSLASTSASAPSAQIMLASDSPMQNEPGNATIFLVREIK